MTSKDKDELTPTRRFPTEPELQHLRQCSVCEPSWRALEKRIREGRHIGFRERAMLEVFLEIYGFQPPLLEYPNVSTAFHAYRSAIEERCLAEVKVRTTFEAWQQARTAGNKKET